MDGVSLFNTEARARLRADLLAAAAADPHIASAAITGSAAAGREDRWSDIDLAFGVSGEAQVPAVLDGWTRRMYEHHHAIHHHDVRAGAWIYRVFFLSNTLQVDLAFVPMAEFRPLGPDFQTVFGDAGAPAPVASPPPSGLIGLGWLYALHVRSALARNRMWQAEAMLRGVRDQAMALACLRHGRTPFHAKGIDDLPPDLLARFTAGMTTSLTASELGRAFPLVLQAFLLEVEHVDPSLAARLRDPLNMLYRQ